MTTARFYMKRRNHSPANDRLLITGLSVPVSKM